MVKRKQTHGTKYIRKIKGRRYTGYGVQSKSSAKADAKRFRGTGKKARVIPAISQQGNKGFAVVVSKRR